MAEDTFTISEVAKAVEVENHVLRYWEEELKLDIKRNQSGHRFYTMENIEAFTRIKEMKENGLQLKAIRMVLFQAKPDVPMLPKKVSTPPQGVTTDEKVAKIQALLKQIISEAVRENNDELSKTLQESVVKELDYQFRMREEAEEAREVKRIEREEEHYRRIDEALRGKVSKKEKRKKHSIF